LRSNEATKTRGGDLGFFSQLRVPPDFFAAVIEMHVGEINKPVRTRLGLHIIQLTDREPPRRMTFDEAREEIGFTLENEKRQAVLQNLGGGAPRSRRVVRLRPWVGLRFRGAGQAARKFLNFCIACRLI
jgi:PPIC-type peptidyl-prolyl cis-trans isomerase-like protein